MLENKNNTIFLVEDDAIERDLWKYIFEKHGYSVITALSMFEAKEKLDSLYDVAVLDLIIPDEDGIINFRGGVKLAGLIEKVKRDIPIFVLTNLPDSLVENYFAEIKSFKGVIWKPDGSKNALKKISEVVRGE